MSVELTPHEEICERNFDAAPVPMDVKYPSICIAPQRVLYAVSIGHYGAARLFERNDAARLALAFPAVGVRIDWRT